MIPRQFNIDTIRTSTEELLLTYVKAKHLSDPGLFGLTSFSLSELLSNGFSRVGDPEFSLCEKEFRILGSNCFVNLKIYFKGEDLFSNGISLNGNRVCKYLNFLGQPGNAENIFSLEILCDDSLEFGSIIINSHLDVRFGILGGADRRKKYHLLGISTDYEIPSGECTSRTSTHGTRALKDVRIAETRKSRKSAAAFELMRCAYRNFPGFLNLPS